MRQGGAGAAALGVLVACATGCVGGGSTVRGGGPSFPSRNELNQLAAQPPAPDRATDRKTLAVDEWAPASDSAPATEAEGLLKRAASAKGNRLSISAELGCAAREIARFFAQHQAFPDQQLQAYMAGACGVTVPTFSAMAWATPNETLASAANQSQWHQGISEQLGQWLPANATLVGGAESSDGKNTGFAALVATEGVDWENKALVVGQSGEVELSGAVRSPAAFVYGLANAGAYGVSECLTDPRVAAPRFRIRCKLADEDSSAWVDIQALPPERVLSHSVAHLLVRRDGAVLSYTAPSKNATAEHVTSAPAFTQRVLGLVNETRAAAHLPSLKIAPKQSETSFKLAPHYFKGEETGDDLNDLIALGLLAGWDVQGTIRSGDFYSTALSGSLDPKRWLGYVLDQPSARRVLLRPEARSIAIGTDLRPKAQTVGALVSTYSFYEQDDHRAELEQFIALLNRQRLGLGHVAAKVTQAPELAQAVLTVKTNHNPEAALEFALEQVVAREQHGVEGYYIEANDLNYVSFPEALLRPQVTIAVSAASHRYPEAAWGTLTVLVVVLESSAPQQTAAITKPKG